MTRSRFCASITLLAALFGAASARAHPAVDEGLRRVELADFGAAARAFEAAERAADLSFDDLLDLFEGQAVLHLALHDEAALGRDLARLASLDPEHRFGSRLPPDLARRFAEVSSHSPGRLTLAVVARTADSHVTVEVSVAHDEGRLVRELKIWTRRTDGSWHSISATELPVAVSFDAVPGSTFEHYAVALGPGNTEVARQGSQAEPLLVSVPGATRTSLDVRTAPLEPQPHAPMPEQPLARPRPSRTWIWVTAISAGVFLIAGGLAIAFIRSDDTQPDKPALDPF